jgi:uncharacterized membrane protein
MSADERKLHAYERQLRWALDALPEADRDSIVAELRSHVLDRLDAGDNLDAILAALGPPNDYARAFCESYEVAGRFHREKHHGCCKHWCVAGVAAPARLALF